MTNEQPEQITEAEQLAVPDWMHQLASKIVLGRHGVGNAGVLIQRAFTERTADLVADNAKMREGEKQRSSLPPDEELLRRAVGMARGRREGARWVAVQQTFLLGATYAVLLCERFGIDPDERV